MIHLLKKLKQHFSEMKVLDWEPTYKEIEELKNLTITGMKRITEIDLQCEDLMWFGVDNQNHIFECTTAGWGNVPEFVCRSRENYEQLLDYFLNDAKAITEPILLKEYEDNYLFKDCCLLSSKGIFCYDVFALKNPELYEKFVEPVEPLNLEDLPDHIKKLLCENKVNVDAGKDRVIKIKHAYSSLHKSVEVVSKNDFPDECLAETEKPF